MDWSTIVPTAALKHEPTVSFLHQLHDLRSNHGTAGLLAHLASDPLAPSRATGPEIAVNALYQIEYPDSPAAGGPQREVRIGIWGATQSGKSTYLAALRLATMSLPTDQHWRIDAAS